jgi:hypothetical protein
LTNGFESLDVEEEDDESESEEVSESLEEPLLASDREDSDKDRAAARLASSASGFEVSIAGFL